MADAMTGVAETPLQYLLRRIPRDAIYRWTTPEADRAAWQLASNTAPIGRLAHEAADRLDKAASPPPREESPAEGAGEIEAFAKRVYLAGHCEGWTGNQLRRDTAQVDAEKGWSLYVSNGALEKSVQAALRNRTSEPEAGFLGHLVTPKGGDAVFVPKGERIPLISQGGSVTPIYDGPQNVTAPATAVKLKVAREALEPFARAAGELDGLWAEDDWRWNDSVRSNVTVRDIRRADQALAALNEQPQ